MMPPARPFLTHIALHVRDLEGCVRFYKDYCGMIEVHERPDPAKGGRVVWLAEPGRESELIFVFLANGPGQERKPRDYSHLGFALGSRAAVDAMAEKARRDGCLLWEPRQEAFPVGYYCGVHDPDGMPVEFSYGQPLGPGAEAMAQPARTR